MDCHYELYSDHKVAIFDGTVVTRAVAEQVAVIKDGLEDDEPYFVTNLDVLMAKLDEWNRHLPSVKPYYAVKCNDDPVILSVLSKLGCGFDCASEQEIATVLDIGAEHQEIIFANPCKTRKSLLLADRKNIKRMTFDTLEEIEKVKKLHHHPELILRVGINDPTAQCKLGGKFGADPSEAPLLLEQARSLGVDVVGISFHVGSGCNEPETFRTAIQLSRQLFEQGKALGHGMRVLDIGGGFPGFDTEKVTFERIARIINESIEEHFGDVKDCELIAEPGRFLVCAPVAAVVKVISAVKIKVSRITKQESSPDKEAYMYYVNQGIFGPFNCKVFDHYFPVGEPLYEAHGPEYDCMIWGPTCDGDDKIEEHTKMRKLTTDDWVYYSDMGAYTNTTSSTFNGFAKPKSYYFISASNWKSIKSEQPCSQPRA